MTSTAPIDVEGLRAGMSGRVVLPPDGDYDEARAMWNGRVDHRPGVVARCADVADVVAAVGYANLFHVNANIAPA